MSLAVLQSPSTTQFKHMPEPSSAEQLITNAHSDEPAAQIDIWSAIQAQKFKDSKITPYVHPLVRRSSSMLSQESLELCTESLGSETGSADFSAFDYLSPSKNEQSELELDLNDGVENDDDYDEIEHQVKQTIGKGLTSVNYHCSISRRSPVKSFPPPLPSISRRNGPCLQMRSHRRDGRLVVEAVAVPSQNYLHAQREGGRLMLSFIDAVFHDNQQPLPEDIADNFSDEIAEEFEEQPEAEVEEEEEDEEEVEVVDRGTVVEVKVSTQPQQQHGAVKVHRSSLVINKFVGGMPSATDIDSNQTMEQKQQKRTAATTTAAAAVVAATTVSVSSGEYYNGYSCSSAAAAAMPQLSGDSVQMEDKLLFTSKLRNRGELLHSMKSCSQLKRPLFIWEPYCIATSG